MSASCDCDEMCAFCKFMGALRSELDHERSTSVPVPTATEEDKKP